MTNHPFTDPDAGATTENLAEGGTWLLDLISAVDHLRRGFRPGLTVWDAVAEALGTTNAVPSDRRRAELVDDLRSGSLAEVSQQLQAALRHWVTTMAARYNNGHHWPHPSSRRDFPTPQLEVDRDHV